MPEATALPRPGDVLADRYLIESVVGFGPMSVIFAARHQLTGKRCAIKLLLPEEMGPNALLSSSEQRRLVGQFRHPNVLEVHDVVEAAGSLCMVMDWMEGESLSARIQRVGPMSLDEVRRLLVPCMRGMHAAHAAGLVHRDLNPTNILVCQPSGHSPEIAKVLDFSVVHFPSAEAAAVAAMSKSFGSPDFLSPEQRFGLPADHRADVYAFGAILYQALSGRPPIAATTFDQRLVFNTPLLPAGVAELRAAGTLLTRALAPELSERFQTLAGLADALEACGRAPR